MITTKGLKPRRIALGLSQAALAEMMGTVQSAVSAWESGEKLPRASQLPALANALQCRIDDLYIGMEEDATNAH